MYKASGDPDLCQPKPFLPSLEFTEETYYILLLVRYCKYLLEVSPKLIVQLNHTVYCKQA